MGTIMGMGSSHWPAMIQPDEARPWPFLRTLDLTVAQIEDAGQQELMTWICVAGAMHELGQKGDVIDYVETAGVFNSGKCLAVWRP